MILKKDCNLQSFLFKLIRGFKVLLDPYLNLNRQAYLE